MHFASRDRNFMPDNPDLPVKPEPDKPEYTVYISPNHLVFSRPVGPTRTAKDGL